MSGFYALFGLKPDAVSALEWHAEQQCHGRVGMLIARIVAQWLEENPAYSNPAPGKLK